MSHRRVKDDDEITKKVVQYVDDPKNSSALAMIHEMSDRAKKAGRSPAIIYNRRMRVDNVEQNNNKINNKNNNIQTDSLDQNIKKNMYGIKILIDW